jgi:hypothetical protein
MTGASGSAYGVDFVRRCPGDKYLVLSDWARQVLQSETGLKASDLESHVRRMFADADLAAPFASGSNRYDAFVIGTLLESLVQLIANVPSIGPSVTTFGLDREASSGGWIDSRELTVRCRDVVFVFECQRESRFDESSGNIRFIDGIVKQGRISEALCKMFLDGDVMGQKIEVVAKAVVGRDGARHRR